MNPDEPTQPSVEKIRTYGSHEKEKALRLENESLKAELKDLEKTFASVKTELIKSSRMRERLDSLAKELENRTKEIKAESHAKIQEAEDQSKELATTVTNNMEFMQDINQSLNAVSNESHLAKQENEDLAGQIGVLKKHYDDREKVLHESLTEAHNSLIQIQTELAQTKLKNAEDKERLFGEMEKVAHGLVLSKQEMKDAKETELGLRVLLKKYDEKFGGLQASLQETNSAYDSFRDEMDKTNLKTKELEKEAMKWQARWEESNEGLIAMSKNHEVLQKDLQQVHDKLVRMTSLCRALQKEISELESQLEKGKKK